MQWAWIGGRNGGQAIDREQQTADPSACMMLIQRRRRCISIIQAMGQRRRSPLLIW